MLINSKYNYIILIYVVLGNVMEVCLVVMTCHVILYWMNTEIDLYTQTELSIPTCTSNRLTTISSSKLNPNVCQLEISLKKIQYYLNSKFMSKFASYQYLYN